MTPDQLPPLTSDRDLSAEELIVAIAGLSAPLHRAIAMFDEPKGEYRLAGAPGLAWFTRDDTDVISHESGTPHPDVIAALGDVERLHRAAAGITPAVANSHLPALLLLCTFITDPATARRLGLRDRARRPARIVALDTEQAKHDPPLQRHDAALRAWTPIAAGPDEHAPVHTAALEMQFLSQRTDRYAPW